MVAEAAGFAVLAALSPTALLVIAVYLGSAQPRRTGGDYLAGAILMSIITGLIVFVALRASGLTQPSEREPRYGLRFGLGVLALSPRTAFIVGLLLFSPSVTFIAAIQAIATARASVQLDVLALAVVVILNVALVWLPFLAHLAAPDWTSRTLTAFNGWLRARADPGDHRGGGRGRGTDRQRADRLAAVKRVPFTLREGGVSPGPARASIREST